MSTRRLRWSEAMWWACQDLNLGPHPYQLNAGNRCADGRFRRSRSTVGAKVMRSIGIQVCVLPMRLQINMKRANIDGPTACPALHRCLRACRRNHATSAATPTAHHGDPQPLLRVDGMVVVVGTEVDLHPGGQGAVFRSWSSLERNSPCVGDALRPWRPDDGEASDPPTG